MNLQREESGAQYIVEERARIQKKVAVFTFESSRGWSRYREKGEQNWGCWGCWVSCVARLGPETSSFGLGRGRPSHYKSVRLVSQV